MKHLELTRKLRRLMEFRIASVKDVEALAEMRWELRTEVHPGKITKTKVEFLSTIRKFLLDRLSDQSWAIWVADSDGEVICQIFVQIVDKVPRPGRFQDAWGYVTNVYTKPGWRGRGVGSELLQHVLAWAKEKDLERLILWPSEESVSFYERAGFSSNNIIMESILRQGEE